MTVLAKYDAAVSALEDYQDTAVAAQDLDNNSALESATLAAAASSAGAALAAIKGDMEDERTGNLLDTLNL